MNDCFPLFSIDVPDYCQNFSFTIKLLYTDTSDIFIGIKGFDYTR